MITVALIGPDGAGKTTIARRLEASGTLPIRYLYMGVSAASSNRALPTTRLAHAIKRLLGAPPDTRGPRARTIPDPPARGGPLKRLLGGVRATLRLFNRVGEEWYRQGLAWRYGRQGQIVLFDRHFFSDYYAYDIAEHRPRPLSRRIHGWMLQHLYPQPDLVLYLDAPAELLLARKGEGTREILEQRRQDYLQLRTVLPHFAVVDASQPVERVEAEVAALIRTAYEGRAQ